MTNDAESGVLSIARALGDGAARGDRELVEATLEGLRAALAADVAALFVREDDLTFARAALLPASTALPEVVPREILGAASDAPGVVELAPSALPAACPSVLRGAVLVVPLVHEEESAIAVFVRRDGRAFGDVSCRVASASAGVLAVAARLWTRAARSTRLQERFEVIVDGSPHAVVYLDQEDRLTWVNAAAGSLLGLPTGHVPLSDVAPAMAELRGRAVNGDEIAAWMRELFARPDTAKNELRWLYREPLRALAVSTAVTGIGRKGGRLWLFVDVTVAHLATEALKAQNEALATARAEADRANASKSDFLAVMSHEIRTPMNGVLGMAKLLLDTSLSAEQRDFAETICSSADSLLAILNDILDFSKVEVGRLELDEQPLDLRACIEGATGVFRAKSIEKGVALGVELAPGVPRAVQADAMRLRQILVNLVGNAMKFTEHGSVRVIVERVEGDLLRFSVKDTGPGIPPDRIDRLFKAFSQADASVSRTHGGTGLGLAISKRLVELMGGRVGVDSTLGAGSTFFFTAKLAEALPSDVLVATVAPAFDASLAGRVPLRILVVDDNSVNQKVARLTLEKLGYTADIANDGQEALVAIARTPYDVVFMDVHMPRMGGIEATKRVRANAQTYRHPRIVAMTASGIASERDRCLDAGMDAAVGKPIVVAELVRTLEETGAARRGVERPAPRRRSMPALPAVIPSSARGSPSLPDTGEGPRSATSPVLDSGAIAGLRALTAGDDMVFHDLLRAVLVGIDEGERQIDRGIAEGDAYSVMMAAHRLRGSTGMWGARSAMDILGKLEVAGRDGLMSDASLIYPRVREELAALRSALTTLT